MDKTKKQHAGKEQFISRESTLFSKFLSIALIFSVFALGFFSAYLVSYYLNQNIEHPFSFTLSSKPATPGDFVNEDRVLIYEDRVVIEIDNASLSRYGATGSMLPVFDEGANGIRVKVTSPDEIRVGDIISYASDGELIVHRIIEIGYDDEGQYFILKGDNNAFSDGKIRFEDIKYKTIGILY